MTIIIIIIIIIMNRFSISTIDIVILDTRIISYPHTSEQLVLRSKS
jgi:hypothetical protein